MSRIEAALNLHYEIMTQLQKMGLTRDDASREALRRMEAKGLKRLLPWQDYFTTVEIEGYSLPHG